MQTEGLWVVFILNYRLRKTYPINFTLIYQFQWKRPEMALFTKS